MTFSLNTIILEPLSKEKPKNAVILCHGYGGDGKDISILASYWRAHLPETIIICLAFILNFSLTSSINLFNLISATKDLDNICSGV